MFIVTYLILRSLSYSPLMRVQYIKNVLLLAEESGALFQALSERRLVD